MKEFILSDRLQVGPKGEGWRVFSLGILVFNSNRLVAQIPEIISFPQINAGSRGFLAYIPYYQGRSPWLLPYCPYGTNLKFLIKDHCFPFIFFGFNVQFKGCFNVLCTYVRHRPALI